ncbi:cid1 family poly A polymerase domain-containing protein [Trichoderma breve]|uniref:polynucleotide adenylyltransferase n=1 Tax=Trichoderma breve TaxID=2034170 RepID=A0A9W9B6N5_9HYPO|nr:cid1 family poly A polymerase domain-containing protein [Trichoderma breve]KAJ4857485.1 cid1 family poly A polymerase domain-containing protein [Trichoderma breve]
MLPNQRERGVEGDGVSGLEGHLRNMILTNANANVNANANQSTNPAGTPSTSRRRPNQAQRRQMQFTVSPEPRQQLPARNAQWPPQQHQQHQQQHQSRSTSGPRSSDFPRSRNSWNGPSQASANRPQYQNPSTMRQYNAAPSRGAHHQSSGSFHYQHRSIRPEEIASQARLLDMLCHQVLSYSEIDRSEIAEKEAFRQRIEHICREVISQFEAGQFEEQPDVNNRIPPFSVELKCFGSLSSGFATKASDLDLGLVSPLSKIPPDAPGSPIPRLIEKAFLQAGLGARLLSRTRVPIIKICELPPEDLFKGLLEAREKWERGLDKETQSGAAEIEPDNDGSIRGEDEDHEQSGVAEAGSDSVGEFEILCKDSTEPQRFRLQQGPKNSLDSYYGLAKRILRRAGGYDITASNCKDFTAADWDILNRVCYAFIQGLADDSLRDHVSRLPSIAAANARSNSLDHRSLFGVFMQVEGENILRQWKSWHEGLPLRQPEDDKVIRQWESLQFRSLLDIEPVTYNRELQLALEKLKKIPSVQLLLFEQDQQETPSQYYTRIRSIVNSLGSSAPAPQSTITSRYVAGVFHEEIRDQLSGYLEQFPEQATIQAVGCRHKSIHLANEFERAIENKLYDAAVVPAIKRYIEILRQPLEKRMMAPGKPYYVVSIPAEFSSDFGKIKALTDPHTMAPNQSGQRQRDPLEFPKSDVGVQCDINFSAHLALQNTLLLRCYSHTDPRVRPMILFVKHWAKMRGINSGYRGTLSSYGYVLMVLHYLVNVAQPFVCPNLQQLAPAPPNNLTPAEIQSTISCRGYNIQFWRNEEEIIRLASQNQLNRNTESVGRGFDWGRNVISLRTHGGILTKQEKGWTGAKTATKNGEVKEIRLRYLFAIEDPFEIDHNVARTVTHNGIVSIRNEFRRAWRILRAAGNGDTQENLLQDVEDEKEAPVALLQLLADIHEATPV